MASLLKVDSLTGVTTAGSISVTGEGNSTTTNLQQGLAKVWTSIDGSGTVNTRDSLNYTSTTDNGTGNYTLTYNSVFANNNYCQAYGHARNAAFNGSFCYSQSDTYATASMDIQCVDEGNTHSDFDILNVTFMGDLA